MSKIVVIGASSGIGRVLAVQLSRSQHEVYGTYFQRGEPRPEGLVSYTQLNILDGQPDFSFLPDIVDGLVYCPGAVILKPFSRVKPEDFTADFELQAVGAVKAIQACLPKLKRTAVGSIVLFSSVAVQTGFNFHTLVSSSKGAVEGLTRALAAELAPRIRVNCIAPSITDTPLAGALLNTPEKREASAQRHPLKRIGTPEDLAALAAFLVTEQSGWITGQVWHADGGISIVRS